MSIIELILISIGLGMDAFAVAVCKGISIKKIDWKKSVKIGLYFGGFQALMPVIGYFLGSKFQNTVKSVDHWIAFVLLAIIGGQMIKNAFNEETESYTDDLTLKTMIILSLATSIDALAVGITFAFLNVNIVIAISFIGTITFMLSIIGTNIGNKFGHKYEKKAEIIGGIILILIGTKILLEHLNII